MIGHDVPFAEQNGDKLQCRQIAEGTGDGLPYLLVSLLGDRD